MTSLKSHLEPLLKSRFGGLYIFATLFILIAFATRTLLMFKSYASVDFSFSSLLSIYGIGLFYDWVAASYFLIPFTLYLTLMPHKIFKHPLHRWFFYTVFFLFIYALVFNSISEWIFWEEFEVRFNFIAVDYLVYTEEVLGNIWESYPVPTLLLAILILTFMLFWPLYRGHYLEQSFKEISTLSKRFRHGLALLMLPILFFFSVDSSFSEISGNRYHSELAKNGIYALFSAFINNKLDYDSFYLKQPEEQVFKRIKNHLKTDNATFVSDKPEDITRLIKTTGPEKKLNILMITIESLSAEYSQFFGHNKNWTPHLDNLAKEGMAFTNFYATGTRTVRGMESLVLSIPPTPGRSIVKRPDNQNLFSSGFLFREKGYDTRFIYGGFGYFDNMNAFFGSNGFDIVDRTDLDENEITFANVWGVSDEDIFNRTLKEADKSNQNGKPFFHFIMSTSNHRPYTYPDGRIDIPSPGDREGAVKYTDFAIHDFIEKAKKHAWFDNTLFVIVADHCAGSAGRTELPIHRYHIPLILYNPQIIPPQTVDTLASQIDLMPTLLGLLNVSYESRFYGKDILSMDPKEGRAFVGTYQKLGMIRENRLAVLGPQEKSGFYRFYRDSEEQHTIEKDDQLLQEAITYYQSASTLYNRGLNRWKSAHSNEK